MKFSKAQFGFTLMELMIVVMFLVIVLIGGGLLISVIHFLAKFW